MHTPLKVVYVRESFIIITFVEQRVSSRIPIHSHILYGANLCPRIFIKDLVKLNQT